MVQPTVEEIRKQIFVQFASAGGLGRARKLSKKRRSQIARKAALARWAKKAKAVA